MKIDLIYNFSKNIVVKMEDPKSPQSLMISLDTEIPNPIT